MKKLMYFLTGLLVGPLAAIAIAQVPTIQQSAFQYFLDHTEIYTLKLPKTVGMRMNTDMFPNQLCAWIDIDKALSPEAGRFSWTTTANYLYMMGQVFGWTTLTAQQRDLCFSDFPPPPPPILPVFKVTPSGTLATRPLYSGQEWESAAKWISIGAVAKDTVCEQAVIRRTTVDYHYVTNDAGVRGLAACK